MIIINKILSATLQIILFSLIPLLVFYISRKKFKGFFTYIGLKTPEKKSIKFSLLIAFLSFSISFIIYYGFNLIDFLQSPGTVSGEIREMGFGITAIFVILIDSIIITGLSEEILFRGFIGKRLYPVIGYISGNIIQAAIFGLIHGVLFYNLVGLTAVIAVTITTGMIGFFLGYLNEILGNGSILPGWIAHSIINIMAFSFLAFIV